MAGLLAPAAAADAVTFKMTAVFNRIEIAPGSPIGFPFGPLAVGTPVEVVWTFDSTMADVHADPALGGYVDTSSFWDVEIRVGAGILISRTAAGRHSVLVDIRTFDIYAAEWLELVGNGSVPVREARFYTQAPRGSAFADDALPVVPPDTSAFDQLNFSLAGPVIDGKFTWSLAAVITDITVVPEPPLAALGGGTLLAMLVRRRRRRTVARSTEGRLAA